MVSSLVYEYSHLATDGIDHHLFAELCSFRLLNNIFAASKYQNIKKHSKIDKTLPSYIASVIYRSMFSVNIAIAAMILIERFQEASRIQGLPFAEEIEDAGRLFLVGYMVAAKVINDEQPHMWFWKKVSNYQYTGYDLNRLELQFYDTVYWKVQIKGEAFNQDFLQMMESYHSYLEKHKLPSVPPPIYQKGQKHETARKRVTFQIEDRRPIPVLDQEDELLFTRALASPAALRNAQWSKNRLQFFRVVLRATPHSHDISRRRSSR